MNGVAWINLARGVFNAVKIWVDPEYEEERDLIIRDFEQNVIRPLQLCFTAKESADQKPFKIALYVLLAFAAICMILGGHQ